MICYCERKGKKWMEGEEGRKKDKLLNESV